MSSLEDRIREIAREEIAKHEREKEGSVNCQVAAGWQVLADLLDGEGEVAVYVCAEHIAGAIRTSSGVVMTINRAVNCGICCWGGR